jgi:hypothetical protein
MFKGFIAWLDSYISREEPSAVLKAMIGLMAFASLLGTILGSQVVRAGAFVAVVVFVASLILLLLTDRRHLTQARDSHRMLLERYCNIIGNSPGPHMSIESWKQRVHIRPNGDVREVLTLKAIALREKVYFVRLRSGSRWDQPEKYRRKIQVVARGLAANGAPGPRWNVTITWQSTDKMTYILHLHQPLKRGEEIFFEVVRNWPAKSLPFIRGNVEDFFFQVSRLLEVQHVEYSIVLPTGFDAVYELIGSTEPDVQLSADVDYDKEQRVFTWRADKVPAYTPIGMRLELK